MSAYNENDHPRDPIGQFTNKPGANAASAVSISSQPAMSIDEQVEFFADQRANAPLTDVVADYKYLRINNVSEGRDIEASFKQAIYHSELRHKALPGKDDIDALADVNFMKIDRLVEAWDQCGGPGTPDGENPGAMLRESVRQTMVHDIHQDSSRATDEFLSVSLQLEDENDELEDATIFDAAPETREAIEDDSKQFMMEAYDILSRNDIKPDQWGGELGLAGAGTGFTDRDYAPKEDLKKLDEIKTRIVGYGDTSPVIGDNGKIYFE